MLVAIDFGISNTDLVVFDKGKTSFYSAPSHFAKMNDEVIPWKV